MMPCSHEKEIATHLRAGQWPLAAAAELRAHAGTCTRCREFIQVRGALQALRSNDMATPRLEAPGVLWWRAQLRRRNTARAQVARPMQAAQLFAFTVVLSFAAGFAVSELRRNSAWLTWLSSAAHSGSLAALFGGWNFLLIAAAIATVALVGGVTLYFSSDRR